MLREIQKSQRREGSSDAMESREWLVKALRCMEKLDPTPVRAMAFVQLQLSQVLHKQGQQRTERSEGKKKKEKQKENYRKQRIILRSNYSKKSITRIYFIYVIVLIFLPLLHFSFSKQSSSFLSPSKMKISVRH